MKLKAFWQKSQTVENFLFIGSKQIDNTNKTNVFLKLLGALGSRKIV